MSGQRPVLIVGGGTYQIPLIHAARARGLPTVVLDGNPVAPGLPLGDESRVVDIADVDAVVATAKNVRPLAIVSMVSEIAVRTCAVAAAAVGVCGLDMAVADAASDKFLMRQRFAAAGLKVPHFVAVEHVADARRAAADVGYPVVVKPVDNSGSRGVTRVDEPRDIERAVQFALSHSRKRRAIVEEFVEGVECTVETFSYSGHTEILGMSDKVRLPFPYCVSICLTYPPWFDASVQACVAEVAKRGLAAVGIDSGPGHVEVMVTREGPVLVELAARGGGCRIFSDITREISGVDQIEAVLDLSLGRRPSIRPTRARAAVLRFFNPKKLGIVRGISGMDEARRLEGVLDVVVDVSPGDYFAGITCDADRPGYVIAVGETRDEVVALADRVEEMTVFDIDETARGARLERSRACSGV